MSPLHLKEIKNIYYKKYHRTACASTVILQQIQVPGAASSISYEAERSVAFSLEEFSHPWGSL
jgi:hypothetical protein